MKIALLQQNIVLGDSAANEEKVAKSMAAIDPNTDLVILPELWNTGYDFAYLKSMTLSEEKGSLAFLRNMAAKYHINILGGSMAQRKDGHLYNMSPLIDRRGVVQKKYRKSHLFPLIKEENYFTAGDQWGIGEVDGVPVGLMICYDLRFPEFCRNLVLRGAKIIFVPAQWPKERLNHWRLLMQGRAIENQVFMVGVNRVGNDGHCLYPGRSLVVDPYGEILVEGGEDEAVLTAEIDIDQVEKCRKKMFALANRLNILDEIDNSYL